MPTQLRMETLDPRKRIRPAQNNPEPVIWIRRLRVLRELRPGPEQIIRDIELRRGLNIVWADPQGPSENRLFENGVAGHTAGKTTFCRLLRYALGEGVYAAASMRQRIRDRLPSGWVIAEVSVAGQLWTVARPLGLGAHPFAIFGGTIEEVTTSVERTDYRAFLEAVAGAVVADLPISDFPTRDEAIGWEHVLPWLSRDQECRFASFIEWRHSSSESDTPALSTDERQFLVRSVLGLITRHERDERERNAALLNQKKEADREFLLWEHQAAVDHSRAEVVLRQSSALPASGLLGSETRAELDRRRADGSRMREELEASDCRQDLQKEMEETIRAEANAQRDLEEVENHHGVAAAAVLQATADALTEEQASLLETLPPSSEFCGAPISMARIHNCPLLISSTIDIEQRRSVRTAEEELELQRELVRSLAVKLAARQEALEKAQVATTEARRAYLTASTEYARERERLLREQSELDHADGLVQQAEDSGLRAEEQAETLERLTTEIAESYQRQEEFRRESDQALGEFSSTFDYVVRAILGSEVQARVESSGRSVSLVVEHNGERDSAALATVKLLAFDLAALTASMEGRGQFPRFLVHDGPREADLAEEVYGRLFLLATQLEQCYDGEPGFQYIVTTTTTPPEALISEPWIRLKIAGVPTEERLLRMDL